MPVSSHVSCQPFQCTFSRKMCPYKCCSHSIQIWPSLYMIVQDASGKTVLVPSLHTFMQDASSGITSPSLHTFMQDASGRTHKQADPSNRLYARSCKTRQGRPTGTGRGYAVSTHVHARRVGKAHKTYSFLLTRYVQCYPRTKGLLRPVDGLLRMGETPLTLVPHSVFCLADRINRSDFSGRLGRDLPLFYSILIHNEGAKPPGISVCF